MMFWDGGGWLWWQATLMWVGMVAFWGLLIWGVYALVTARRPGDGQVAQGGGAHRRDGAISILNERLARGEIDSGEYQRLRDLIGSGDSHVHAGTGDGANTTAGTGSRN